MKKLLKKIHKFLIKLLNPLKIAAQKIFSKLRVLNRTKKLLLPFFLGLIIILIPVFIFLIRNARNVQADWWQNQESGTGWLKRQQLNITNNSGDSLATETTIAVTINTKELVNQGKLQTDCDDLRVVFQSGSTATELDRYISYPGGGTCGTSEASKVYFKLQSALSDGSTATTYYMYYDNQNAATPSGADDAFDISSKDALLVCSFDGTTTCAAGETPSTETGAIRYTGEKSALSFDGSDDYIDGGSGSTIDDLGPFTFEGWFYIHGLGSSSSPRLFLKGDNFATPNNNNIQLYISSVKQLIFNVGYSTTDLNVTSASNAISYETWQHITVTWDGTTESDNVHVYVGGTEVSYTSKQDAVGSRNSDAAYNLYIGNSHNQVRDYHGYMDEIRVSNIVRYTSSFTPPTSPFVRDEYTKLLLHLDENGDDPRNTGKVIDDSGNANHGTITGAKYVAGLIGVDNNSTTTGKAGGGNSYAGHEGIFLEEGTTNKVTNPSFEYSTFNNNWDAQGNLEVQNLTSAGTQSNGSSFQRKTWFDGTRYWTGYYDYGNGDVLFFYSSDGINWTQNTGAALTSNVQDYSVYGDSSNLFIVYKTGGNIMARSATSYPGSNFTWGTEYTVFDTANTWYGPYITRDSNNYLWATANEYTGGNMDIYAVRSTNTNDPSTWNSSVNIGTGTSTVTSVNMIVPLNSGDVYAVYYEGTVAYGCFYDSQTDGRWEDSGGNDCTNGVNQDLILAAGTGYPASAVSDTTNYDVHLLVGHSSGPQYFRWDNGTGTNGTWQTAVDLGDQAVDPSISIDTSTGDLYGHWYDWNTNTVMYSTCDVSAAASECSTLSDWAATTNIQTGLTSQSNAELSSNYGDSGRIYLTWVDGTTHNWIIKWAQVLGPDITATENSSAPYYKFGAKSATLAASGGNGYFNIPIDPNAASSHTISAYVYEGTSGNVGGTVNNTVAQLVWEGVNQSSTTYTDMGGGWWRLTYSGTTTDTSNTYGLYVLSGKTVYVDGFQLEAKSYTTTYADGSLESDSGGSDTYFWDDDCDGTLDAGEDETGDQNTQCSTRTGTNIQYNSSGNISTNGTISFWYKREYQDLQQNARLFKWDGFGAQDYIYMYLQNATDPDLRVEFYTDGGTSRSCGNHPSPSIDEDEWHMITLTYTTNSAGADGCQLYVDAAAGTAGSSGQSWTFAPDASTFEIGNGGGTQAGGSISDFRITDSALTATEVADLYYAGLVSHSGTYETDAFDTDKGQNPVGIYHFDESYGSTAHDSSTYANDLTISGATWSTQSANAYSRLTRNLSFDGTDDYASASAQISKEMNFGTGSFSISGWFRHSSTISGTDTIVSKYNEAGYKVYMNAGGLICFGIDQDSTFDGDIACSTESFADSKWHHFEAVKDATTSIKIYIDGYLKTTDSTIGNTGTLSNTSALYVGSDSNGSDFWTGQLDEIVFYPYARDESQVKEDYLGSQIAQLYGAQAFDTLTHGLTGYWKMDSSSWNGTSGEVTDSSINSNDGTSSMDSGGTAVTTTTTGKFGQAGDIDGADDYLAIPHDGSLSPTNQFTISAWINPDSTFSGSSNFPQTILDKGDYRLYLDHSDGKIKFVVNDDSAKSLTLVEGATSTDFDYDNVYVTQEFGGNLYIGGSFDDYGGNTDADNIAKWDGSSWSWPAGQSLSSYVRSLILWNGELYAAGSFIDAGGDTDGDRIAKWNGTSWEWPTGMGLNASVNALIVWNNELYAGGDFTNAGGDADADYIAKWDGSSWSWPTGQTLGNNQTVNDLATWKGELYVGGKFVNAGGDADADRIAKWNGTSWEWPTGMGLSNDVTTMIAWDGNLYAGGTFTSAGGDADANYIAMWNGSSWSWPTGAQAALTGSGPDVVEMSVHQGKLWLTGRFSDAGGDTTADGTAMWDGTSFTNPIGCTFSSDNGSNSISSWKGDLLITTNVANICGVASNDHFLRYGTDVTKIISSTTDSFTSGTWYHTLITYDGYKLSLYINGILESSVDTSLTLNNSSLDLIFGKSYGSSNSNLGQDERFDGKIDEVRIYNRPVSHDEVENLYAWTPGPAGYWNFNENTGTTVYDTSGNGNNGTLSNSGWGLGKYGSAMLASQDGAQDVTTISDPASGLLDLTDTSDFTYTLWTRITQSEAGTKLINKGFSDALNAPGYTVYYTEGGGAGAVNCYIGDGTNFDTANNIGAGINDGQWHHIACVLDRDGDKTGLAGLYLYVDGILYGSDTSISTTDASNSDNITIGEEDTSSEMQNGGIDDVRIYNYARTRAQIIEDMNAGHPAPGSPVGSALGHWKLDEGYGSTAHNSGNGGADLDGTITSATWSNSGKFGKALSFNGSDSIVDFGVGAVTTELDGASAITLETWMKPQTYPGGTSRGRMISLHVADGNSGALLSVYGDNSVEVAGRSVAAETLETATAALSDPTEWHHIVGILDFQNDQIKIYVDGILSTTQSVTFTNTLYTAGTLTTAYDTLGAYKTTVTGDFYDGFLDSTKIYKFALTDDQVKTSHNAGMVSVFGSTGTNSSNNPTWSSANEYCPPGQGSACTSPIAEWKFDEKTGQVPYDTSGSGNNGTLGTTSGSDSSDPSWSHAGSCKSGSCLLLDGSSDYINVGTSSNFYVSTDTAATLNFWLKDNSIGTGISRLFVLTGTSNSDVRFGFGTRNSGRYLSVDYRDSGGAAQTLTDTTTSLSDGKMHMATLVFSGTTVSLYIDGKLLASDTDFSATNSLNGGSAESRIGQQNSTFYWNGIIDNVTLYDYARSPAQVAWEYNKGSPIGWWKFDECSGTTAYDSSGNGNNGTITPGASGNTSAGTCGSGTSTEMWNDGTSGKINSSLGFDGDDDYVTMGDPSSGIFDFGADQTFSISFWMKADDTDTTQFLISKRGAAAAGYEFRRTPTSGWFLRMDEPVAGIVDTQVRANLADGNWHHIVFGRDTSRHFIYVDGSLDNSYSDTSLEDLSNSEVFAVSNPAAANGTNGQVDDIRVFNYALTVEQIRDIINYGAVRFD
ncbi:hypothetical protein C4561_00625 [candidate division WWE3 bacterium]|jgi:hypothetical protein|uniref:LamG-like jellyroll fold domain-containing protein n=1 Tax=candidate division WWE3 bacterium TaxID=2053526 RepID=A0A3A4ZFQ5_UNCKA|nr:MAG: hypothetical protein C4561_00625 [candidate division WWE3 bacterium]